MQITPASVHELGFQRIVKVGGGNYEVFWHPSDPLFISLTIGSSPAHPLVDVYNMNGVLQRHLAGHTTNIHEAAWNPAGTLLATSDLQHDLWIWSYPEFQPIYHDSLPDRERGILKLQWSTDGSTLTAYNRDVVMMLRSIGSSGMTRTIQLLPKTKFLASSLGLWHPTKPLFVQTENQNDTQLHLAYRTATTALLARIPLVLDTFPHELCWVQNGKRLALRTSEQLFILGPDSHVIHAHPFTSLWVWRQGLVWNKQRELLAAVDGTEVVILDAAGSPRWTCRGHSRVVATVAWNQAGTVLATGSWDRTIKLWDCEGKLLHTLPGYKDDEGKVLPTYSGHGDAVFSLEWSSDDTRLVSVSRCYEIFLWGI